MCDILCVCVTECRCLNRGRWCMCVGVGVSQIVVLEEGEVVHVCGWVSCHRVSLLE
jgi:hypothetical protein